MRGLFIFAVVAILVMFAHQGAEATGLVAPLWIFLTSSALVLGATK